MLLKTVSTIKFLGKNMNRKKYLKENLEKANLKSIDDFLNLLNLVPESDRPYKMKIAIDLDWNNAYIGNYEYIPFWANKAREILESKNFQVHIYLNNELHKTIETKLMNNKKILIDGKECEEPFYKENYELERVEYLENKINYFYKEEVFENEEDFPDEQKLSKLDALIVAGVDNWEFYNESIEEFCKENNISDEENLSDEDLLNALEMGGVDNWSGYEYAMDLIYS